jgi:hypothetical protein
VGRSGGTRAVIGPKPSAKPDIDVFLEAVAQQPVAASSACGRLIFAVDATMSRQPTWDLAQSVQGKMFETAAAHGGLEVQLIYYRGFGECKASPFVSGSQGLGSLMARISVAAGETQIAKVLHHVLREMRRSPVRALVFIGDAMEERIDELGNLAAEIGLLGAKAFLFQEGRDKVAEKAFRQIALLTGGAYATFDASAPERLIELLSAAAAYAAGGRPALESEARTRGAAADLLLAQMR